MGDIESQPFLEAIRQLKVELGSHRAMLMHLTLVPYIKTAGETKTKPTQHSVKELRSIGLQPDILVCRSPSITLIHLLVAKFPCLPTWKSVRLSLLKMQTASTRSRKCCMSRSLDQIIVERFGLDCKEADLVRVGLML